MSKVTPIMAAAKSAATKTRRSRMDTVLVEMRTLAGWKIPPFQRQLRVNEKVREISGLIREDGGVIPGIITIGVIKTGRDAGEYLVDGQHRVEAFRLSECREAVADVRYVEFETMADMGNEFVNLNSSLVRMRPDDVLRGLEESTPALRTIRDRCPFVGYDMIRRGPTSAMLSMSTALRVWEGSVPPTPVALSKSAVNLAVELSEESVGKLSVFLSLVYEAWGMDEGAKRLWSSLNLSLCMWLWRRLVDDTARSTNRYVVLRNEQFKKCMMSLAADASYNDWLLGRALGDRDRPPAYARIKQILMRRLLEDKFSQVKKITFPSPTWAKQ